MRAMKLFRLCIAAAGLLAALQGAIAKDTNLHVRLNQIGYRPADSKIAVAFSTEPIGPSFSIYPAEHPASDSRAAFEGRVTPLPGLTRGKWPRHAELDFSKLKKPGRYVLRVGQATSPIFAIGDTVYQALPDQLLEFMREQRCGYNPWLGKPCHTNDGRTAYGPLPYGTELDCTGGWHDAADLLKYLITSANATAQMLLAWQTSDAGTDRPPRRNAEGRADAVWRGMFKDIAGSRGDAGPNGVPDILDEARWGLEWMLKLHPAPQALYHQVADDRDHCGPRLPYEEIADYGWGKGSNRVVYFADGQPQGLGKYKSEATGVSNLAGRYAAAMALGYSAFKDLDGAFARKCLQAGVEVYALGRGKEGSQQGNSCKEPYRYEETTWADDMEWGAATLYRVTGGKHYLEEAKRYAQLAASESWMGQEQTRHYQYYPFMNAGHFTLYESVDPKLRKLLAQYYREGIERCVRMGERNPYRAGVPFIWCSNNLMVALVTQCLLYERMTGDTRYHGFMVRQRDWLLGRNPWGTSMFTEIPAGGIYPRQPHLTTTWLTKRSIRGGLVDGPVYERIFKSQLGVHIQQPDPFADFQSELAVYHDDHGDYVSNEPTMDGTASAILMWALSN
jgi:endoglucanase